MKSIQIMIVALMGTVLIYGQITYDYYSNPDKIGSPYPNATAYFIKSFEFIMQWGSEDTDSAIYYMEKAIEEDSLYAIAYASLGHMLKYYGYDGTSIDLDSIEQLADKAMELNPTCGDALTLKSYIHFMKGEYQKAIDICKRAVEVEPDHRETWLWLGIRYSHLPDKTDSAIMYFEKTLEVDPDFGQPHQKLGYLFLVDKKDYPKAAYHFTEMIRLYEEVQPRDERMIVGYQGLGESLLRNHKIDAAIDTFKLALLKCESSQLHWIDQIRSWSHRGLAECYMAKSRMEIDSLIDIQMSAKKTHPYDTDLASNILNNLSELEQKLSNWDFRDTLKQLKAPLVERVLSSGSNDAFIIIPTLHAVIFPIWAVNDHEGVQMELESLLDTYSEHKNVTNKIYYFMALNYMKMENTEMTLEMLHNAVKDGFTEVAYLEYSPTFEGLKQDPEYKKIVNQMSQGF